MYSKKRDPLGGGCRFVIRPNHSLSWRELLVFFYICLSVSLTISIAFLLMGAWLILPFSGLEMILLFAGLYTVAKRCSRDCEWITVREDEVQTVVFTGKNKTTNSFSRHWVKLRLEEQDKWYTSQLLIGSHGRFVEIGTQLAHNDKRELFRELNDCLKTKSLAG
ncbi:MAG: DUF2244 domain-containing protein [Gammaproteobacteria bacterium]|nr:DUF2244 domain-containing protein [Gammaproteobacteria bacterium]